MFKLDLKSGVKLIAMFEQKTMFKNWVKFNLGEGKRNLQIET